MLCCCGGADSDAEPPQFMSSSAQPQVESVAATAAASLLRLSSWLRRPSPPTTLSAHRQTPWTQADELRGRLSAILRPVEVDWTTEATINLSSLPSASHPGLGNSPLGAFERRHSIRPGQHSELAAAAAQGQRQEEVDGRRHSVGLMWTDSRKLLEAAIGMEQLEAIPEDIAASRSQRWWGWGGGGWGKGALDAAEQRLQVRLGG